MRGNNMEKLKVKFKKIIVTVIENFHYIVATVLYFLSLLAFDSTKYGKFKITFLMLFIASLIWIIIIHYFKAKTKEKRIAFAYYVYAAYLFIWEKEEEKYIVSDDFSGRSKLNDCFKRKKIYLSCFLEEIINYKSHLWDKFSYEPSFDSPLYEKKFIYFADSINLHNSLTEKEWILPSLFCIFDSLLISYHFANVNEPINESDAPLFDVLIKELKKYNRDIDFLNTYKQSFCLRESRAKIAKELTQWHHNRSK